MAECVYQRFWEGGENFTVCLVVCVCEGCEFSLDSEKEKKDEEMGGKDNGDQRERRGRACHRKR